jgi:methylmalonyl-CoA mutase N-terminal domain/subunit
LPDSSAEAHLPVDLTPKGDALRDRVFEAALGLFAEKGYHATSVDEILREAGVSKGGFYHHFKSKEDVLYAIKETFADYVRRGILEIDGNDASPSEKIRAVIRMLLGIIAQHRSHIVIFVQENGTLGPDRVAAIRSRHAASDHLVRSMVEAGVAEGEFRASIQEARSPSTSWPISTIRCWCGGSSLDDGAIAGCGCRLSAGLSVVAATEVGVSEFDESTLQRSRELEEQWRELTRAIYKDKAEGIDRRNLSDLPLKPTYLPHHIDHIPFDKIGAPGVYPFTRGLFPLTYQVTPWIQQPVLGYGSVRTTREKMESLVRDGMVGFFGRYSFNVVFDNPTKGGIDADRREARGHVGVDGMNVSTPQDLEELVAGYELDKTRFVFITGDTCLITLGFYIVAAEKHGYPPEVLRGNSMNWLLKGCCVDNPTFPPEAAMRLMVELIAYCTRQVPKWNTTNLLGYLMNEAGASAAQQLAFTVAYGIDTIEHCLRAGLDVDDFAQGLGFQMGVDIDFMEGVALLRALRRLWAETLKERFGSQRPDAQWARIHVHTCGHALVPQQPLNNLTRAALQTLAAVCGGANAIHTSAYTEPVSIPTEEASRLALRTQQIILHESGIPEVSDPLGGSYYLEHLTDQMVQEARSWIDRVEDRGGFARAVASGWVQEQLIQGSQRFYREVESGERIKVGLNQYQTEEAVERPEVFRIDPAIEREVVERVGRFKAERSDEVVERSLSALARVCESDPGIEAAAEGRIMDAILDCARARCTQGEVMDVLKEQYGWGYFADAASGSG